MKSAFLKMFCQFPMSRFHIAFHLEWICKHNVLLSCLPIQTQFIVKITVCGGKANRQKHISCDDVRKTNVNFHIIFLLEKTHNCKINLLSVLHPTLSIWKLSYARNEEKWNSLYISSFMRTAIGLNIFSKIVGMFYTKQHILSGTGLNNLQQGSFWLWSRPMRDGVAIGTILGMESANESRRDNVTSSLIGWTHNPNDTCIMFFSHVI